MLLQIYIFIKPYNQIPLFFLECSLRAWTTRSYNYIIFDLNCSNGPLSLSHWHYERTLHSRRPWKRTGVSIYLFDLKKQLAKVTCLNSWEFWPILKVHSLKSLGVKRVYLTTTTSRPENRYFFVMALHPKYRSSSYSP